MLDGPRTSVDCGGHSSAGSCGGENGADRHRKSTKGRGSTSSRPRAGDFVRASGVDEGLLTVFVRHTSASLIIQENADPDVKRDLHAFSTGWYRRPPIAR